MEDTTQLSYASPGRQRMLSSFAYTRFAQTIGARAHDAGIEIVEVSAAYSSKSVLRNTLAATALAVIARRHSCSLGAVKDFPIA
jgi:hypothetical protein